MPCGQCVVIEMAAEDMVRFQNRIAAFDQAGDVVGIRRPRSLTTECSSTRVSGSKGMAKASNRSGVALGRDRCSGALGTRIASHCLVCNTSKGARSITISAPGDVRRRGADPRSIRSLRNALADRTRASSCTRWSASGGARFLQNVAGLIEGQRSGFEKRDHRFSGISITTALPQGILHGAT